MNSNKISGVNRFSGKAGNRQTVEISKRISANVVVYREQAWCHIFEVSNRSKTVSLNTDDLQALFNKEKDFKLATKRVFEKDLLDQQQAETPYKRTENEFAGEGTSRRKKKRGHSRIDDPAAGKSFNGFAGSEKRRRKQRATVEISDESEEDSDELEPTQTQEWK